jgi:hypothetical protein
MTSNFSDFPRVNKPSQKSIKPAWKAEKKYAKSLSLEKEHGSGICPPNTNPVAVSSLGSVSGNDESRLRSARVANGTRTWRRFWARFWP